MGLNEMKAILVASVKKEKEEEEEEEEEELPEKQ